MPNSEKNELILCFVDGEPHLYNKKLKKYIKLNLNYDLTLNLIQKELKNVTRRPKMQEIWRILATLIKCCERYSFNYNKKSVSKDLTNSFENRLTRDISSFLDLSFKRLTDEEKEERTKELKALKESKERIHEGIRTLYQISGMIQKR